MNDLLTFESGVEIVHLKGDVRNIADELMKRTVVLETYVCSSGSDPNRSTLPSGS